MAAAWGMCGSTLLPTQLLYHLTSWTSFCQKCCSGGVPEVRCTALRIEKLPFKVSARSYPAFYSSSALTDGDWMMISPQQAPRVLRTGPLRWVVLYENNLPKSGPPRGTILARPPAVLAAQPSLGSDDPPSNVEKILTSST
ncbi:hypothetical protein DFH08DRAFT_808497 [Mycena albidolilacea]|uniref:Uncharacterized protein n=1 Tax=Mycena albidolilacea TaxID=1033008 RepID=A0AAD7A1N5_9AGAR|nr:hypothetical protein DFH08DRAFT_808497 [Mycena albidolilacea]